VIVDVEGGAGNQLIHMVCVYVHERAQGAAQHNAFDAFMKALCTMTFL
jgi:hypothetical protein